MTFWLIAGLAAFCLGFSKGGIPIIASLSVPLMALYLDPVAAAGLLLPLYLMADWVAIYMFRAAYSARNLKILIPSAALGVIAGFASVSVVSPDAVRLLLAAIGLAYLGHALWQRVRVGPVTARRAALGPGLIFGALAGFTSYIAHSGGPPFQAYVLPQKLDKRVYLGTVTLFFAVVNVMKVPPYLLAGQMSMDTVLQSLWLAPAALAGAWCGARISLWMPERVFYLLVELALAAVCAKLIWDVWAG